MSQQVPATFNRDGTPAEPFDGASLVSVEFIEDIIAAWASIPGKCEVVEMSDGTKYYRAADVIEVLDE